MADEPAVKSKPLDTYDMKMLTGRLYDPGYKLKEAGKVSVFHLGGSTYHAVIREKGVKNVVFRDRGNGKFEATCDCTEKPMGCKHCVAAVMEHLGFTKGQETEQHVFQRIDEVSRISTEYGDYKPTPSQARYQDWQFIDKVVVEPAFKAIACTIDENAKDEATRIAMYRKLAEMCEYRYDGVAYTTLCDLMIGHGISFLDDPDDER